jgi:hypothetical protein
MNFTFILHTYLKKTTINLSPGALRLTMVLLPSAPALLLKKYRWDRNSSSQRSGVEAEHEDLESGLHHVREWLPGPGTSNTSSKNLSIPSVPSTDSWKRQSPFLQRRALTKFPTSTSGTDLTCFGVKLKGFHRYFHSGLPGYYTAIR